MNPQILNLLTDYSREARNLVDLVGRLKALRVRYDGLGLPAALPEGQYPGDLSHITNPRVTAFIALVDAFDGVLTHELQTPAGKIPAGAVALAGVVR